MRTLKLPGWSCDGRSFGEQGSDLDYDLIIVRIVDLRHRIYVLSKTRPASDSASKGLAIAASVLKEEARRIDIALQG